MPGHSEALADGRNPAGRSNDPLPRRDADRLHPDAGARRHARLSAGGRRVARQCGSDARAARRAGRVRRRAVEGFLRRADRRACSQRTASRWTTLSRLDRPTMLAFVDLEGEEPRYAFYDCRVVAAELAAGRHAGDRARREGAAFRLAVADPAAGGERLRRADAARSRGGASSASIRTSAPAWSRTRRDYRARLSEILPPRRRDQAEPAPISHGSRPARTSRRWPPNGSRRRRASCC